MNAVQRTGFVLVSACALIVVWASFAFAATWDLDPQVRRLTSEDQGRTSKTKTACLKGSPLERPS